MAYTITHTQIKQPSRQTIERMRQIGEEKARRLQQMRERWKEGNYDNVEVVHL